MKKSKAFNEIEVITEIEEKLKLYKKTLDIDERLTLRPHYDAYQMKQIQSILRKHNCKMEIGNQYTIIFNSKIGNQLFKLFTKFFKYTIHSKRIFDFINL